MELFRHELYKVFSRKTVWIGLLFVIVLVCFSSYAQASQCTKDYGDIREYYNDFFKGKEGTVSDRLKQSADDWLKENIKSYNLKFGAGQASVQENRTANFNFQAISPDNFSKKRNDEIAKLRNGQKNAGDGYQSREDALQAEMLENLRAPGLYFTLPLENDAVFPEGLGFVVMGILVLLGISPVFSEEYSSNMDSLILSSKKGRRSAVTAKILSTVVYCIFTVAVVLLVYFLVQASVLGVQGLNAPLQQNYSFGKSPYSLTYGGYLALQAGLCAAACIFFGMLVLLVSAFSSNVLIPFFVCGALFASTAFLKTLGDAAPYALTVFSDFSYTELMRAEGLVNSFRAYNILGYPVLYLNLILIIYAVITAVVIVLTYQVFRRRQVGK